MLLSRVVFLLLATDKVLIKSQRDANCLLVEKALHKPTVVTEVTERYKLSILSFSKMHHDQSKTYRASNKPLPISYSLQAFSSKKGLAIQHVNLLQYIRGILTLFPVSALMAREKDRFHSGPKTLFALGWTSL